MQTERVKALKVVSICILLSMGSVSAWGGEKPSSSGEIVIKHVGDMHKKIVTMQGEIKMGQNHGFYFMVPGKKIDIKCNSYPYGVPDNPYNNMSGIRILLNNPNTLLKTGEFGTYRFSLACPMAGPFIADIKRIGEHTQN